MATSYVQDPAPELVPVLDGKKVVFTRKEVVEAEAKAEEAKADEPQTVDAEDSKAAAQRRTK